MKCLWVGLQVGPRAEAGDCLLLSQEWRMLFHHTAVGF